MRLGTPTTALLLGAALSAGCAVHEPGFDDPLALPASFVPDDDGSAFASVTPDRWWEAFGDPGLNAIQARSLAGNFDLATFGDRLAAARAVVERERSLLLPALDYALFGQQVRREDDGFEGEDRFGASLLGSYDVDVWQRNTNIAAGAAFRAAIAREQLVAAAISLSTEVALTWFALVEQRGQLRVLGEQIRTNEDVLTVVQLRFASGVVRASDVLRQERLLESTREQRAVVLANIEVLEQALLVLSGRSPTEPFGGAPDELPPLPPRPALGLPSELVGRRPDIRSALLAVEESDAAIAVAVAERYPSVRLRLEASTVEEALSDLFDNWAALLRVDVVGPLFDGGRRSAEVDRATAVKAERVNEYAQTVLRAFEQVLNAISLERGREAQIGHIRRQLALARRTSERLNREYLNGDISYIDVLDALTTEQQLQRDLLRARFDRIADRVNLYRALAGGWPGVVPDEDPGPTRVRSSEAEAVG